MRDVGLAVLAEVRPVGVDDGRGVVVDPGRLLVLLVHRRDDDHAGLLGEILHPLGRRAVGDELGVAVVLGVLDLAEVRPVEELLEQDDLGALLGRLVRPLLVLLDHRFLVAGPAGLDERATDDSRHGPHHLVSRYGRDGGERVHRGLTGRWRLVRLGLGSAAHVVLGELAAAPVLVEAAHEDVRELAVDRLRSSVR